MLAFSIVSTHIQAVYILPIWQVVLLNSVVPDEICLGCSEKGGIAQRGWGIAQRGTELVSTRSSYFY